MTRAEELRAQARSLYDLAKTTPHPDESLLHILHALELEIDAELIERGDVPKAHVIDSRVASANRTDARRRRPAEGVADVSARLQQEV